MFGERVINVPDDTRQRPAQPSMWGINSGEHKEVGNFYCNYCNCTWVFNFPRYDRYLNKTNYIEDAVANKWPCPGCVQKNLILVEEIRDGQIN